MNILYVDNKDLPRMWYNKQNFIKRAVTYEEAIEAIKHKKYDIIDIKLEIDGSANGCDVIRYIIKNQLNIPCIYIHSKDSEIRNQMIKLIKNFTKSNVQYYEIN